LGKSEKASVSKQDWWDQHVLAMIYIKEANFVQAEQLLLDGVENTSFPKSKRIYQSSLSFLHLQQKQASKVLEQVDTAQIIDFPEQAIFRVQALAETEQTVQAQKALDEISSKSAEVIQMSKFLRQRYWGSEGASAQELQELDAQITQQSIVMIMRTA
jgi:F420-dependent methylenetetrahydromethanopterin dehydrogenase